VLPDQQVQQAQQDRQVLPDQQAQQDRQVLPDQQAQQDRQVLPDQQVFAQQHLQYTPQLFGSTRDGLEIGLIAFTTRLGARMVEP